jgi:hypothetical protein
LVLFFVPDRDLQISKKNVKFYQKDSKKLVKFEAKRLNNLQKIKQ